jgi:hypothetical protein
MNLAHILLGIINIFLVAAIMVLVGLIIVWLASLLKFDIPDPVQKVYLVIVLLVVIYMFVALLLGGPTINLFGLRADAVLLHHA